MSLSIYILCKSDRDISRSIVASILQKIKIFERAVISEPDPNILVWSTIHLTYASEKKPIVLSHYVSPSKPFARIIKDILIEFSSPIDSTSSNHVLIGMQDLVKETLQMIVIDVDPLSVSEGIWKALDTFEAMISFKFSGHIFVPGEGIYDAGLGLICNTSKK